MQDISAALDDHYWSEFMSDVNSILNDGSLDYDEKVMALLELPDPTMDEEKAERLIDEHEAMRKHLKNSVNTDSTTSHDDSDLPF